MDITALKSPEEGGFISKEDFTTPEQQDTLLLQYPALADKINTALQSGVNRDVLRERLAQCESLALTQYNPSEINNYLGRTEKTQNAFYDAMKEQKDNSYVEIMRHKMQEDKVRDVIRTAELSGFDPGVLLMRPEILSIAEEIAGERRSTAGALFYAAPRNMMAGLREGDAGEYTYEALELKQVLDDDYLLLKEGQREYELGRSGAGANPTEEELKELGRQSYLKRIEDWEKKAVEAAKDAKAWKTSVRLPDGFTGTVYNAITNGGFTIKSAIRSAVAWQLGGPVGGFFMSMANTFSEAHSEAGRALLDELERSGDEKKALEIANGVYKDNLTLLPTTNYGGDFLLHGANNFFMDAAAELIPGGGILSKIGRGLFRVGVPMVLNSIPEGVEEYMQELFPMERAGLEIDERRLNEAAKMGFIDSILYSAVGLGSDAALRGIRRITPSGRIEAKVQKVLKETLKDSIDLAEKIDSGEIKLDDVIAQDPIVFIPKSKITEEIAQALNIESETTENNEEIINPEKTAEVSETPDAINVKEVAGEEAAAIESETAPEDEEIAIKKEDWEKFAAENPEQAQTLQANVREGINGITAEEQLKRNMNKMRQTVFDNSEAKIEYDRLVKELTEAGRSKEEAERLSTIAGAVAITMNKQYKNISIRQAMNLSAIKSNEQIRTISRQAESHNQRRLFNNAEERLKADSQAWSNLIDRFITNKLSREEQKNLLPVMQTPLVFNLVGVELLPIEIRLENINKIIKRKHLISPEILKQIPKAITDPIMIFKSEHDTAKGRDSKVILTELKDFDENNVERSIIAAITLKRANRKNGYEINELSTVFKKNKSSKEGLTPEGDIIDWVNRTYKNGEPMHLLEYINKEKSLKWITSTGTTPKASNFIEAISNNIPDETDLVKLRNKKEYEGYYQTSTQNIEENIIPQKQVDTVRRQYEGTDKWLKAPNGKKSNLSEAQWLQVRTPNFKKWFGDWENDAENASKVVDENGEPLVVYHGNPNAILNLETTLREKRTVFNVPFSVFRVDKGEGKTERGAFFMEKSVYPMYGFPSEFFLNLRNPATNENKAVFSLTDETVEKLIKDGYDGVIRDIGIGNSEIIAFNPEQIKSATDNRGTFDPNNRDIYYQTQPSGSHQEQAKFYEEFNSSHERPEYLNTGNVTANINDYGNGVEIEFLGQRANGISRSAQFPSGRKASQSEREGVIKYLLYDAMPELELRIHDMFGGFPTVELQQKYNGGMPDGGNIKNLTDEQKNEIFSAAESLIQQIMGSPLSKDGRELISKAYGEISFNDKSNKTSTEQENNEQEVLKAAEPKFNLSDEQIEELFEDGEENTDNLEYGENGEPEYETPIEEWDNLDTEEEIINARTSWPKNTSSAETQSLVEFFSTANKSSGFHELAHHILRVLTDAYLEGAEDYVLINDVETILKNAKVSKEDFINNKGTAREEAHEYFAKAFETYLYEGHAPTQELANTFERIKQWLVEVYHNIKESLGIELNEEMRDIFDRLLATPEQLAEQKSISDIDTLYEATEDELELSQEAISQMESELAEIQARQEFLEEMQRYDIKAIPDNILESVREWIEDKENEGLTEEAYSTDLHSKQKLVRERARQALLNTEIGVPLIEINADTVNALIAEGGVEIAKKYLTERRQYLNKLVSELQKLMPGKFAKTASQNSLIENLTKKRQKLYNALKRAREQGNIYLQRQLGLTLETINEKLKELREGKKNPQAEYDTAKKDIDAGIKEQADIREWLNALDKIDPETTANEAEEANVNSRDTLLTLTEAMIKGYEMAEKYSLEGFTEGQNFQAQVDNEQRMKELEKLNTEHREDIKDLNKKHEKEISNLKNEIEKAYIKGKNAGEQYAARDEREYQQKVYQEKLVERITKMKETQKKMRERQRERQNIKKNVAKLVKNINRMAKAQNVDWFRQQDIKNLLDIYDTAKLRSLSLQDIQYLHDQVKEIYEKGKRELAQKRLAQQKCREQARRELAEPLRKDWENRPKGVATSSEETGKQYKGVKGRVQKILDWTTAKTFGAQRFFDYLDGYKHNKGAFSKYFLDDVNDAYNTKLIHKYARLGAMEKAMARLGIRAKDLAKTREFSTPHRNSKNWTVEELIGIYAGLKNPKSRDAILFGNFSIAESYEQAEAWANEAVSKLSENEKALGDFIIQEYEDNFERINNALVKVWNRGMNHEENYTPIRRLEVTSSKGGMINPDVAAEALINPNSGGSFGRVERGFSQSRVNFGENAQPGMNLKIFSVWYSQVEAQEHAAAFGEVVQNLRRILLSKGKNSEASIYKMIKETHGKYAAEMIKQYFNIAATNETMQAYNSLDDIAKFLAKNMSIAYLCCNMGTALKQINSLAFVIPYASPTDVINNFIKATTDWENFSKECFQLDPQLKARNGDPIIRELRKGEGVVYDNLLKWASTPIGFMDRFTSCVVFKSVYDSNLRQGLSQNDAIKEAQRVVLLTQPPAHIKDKPLIWQQHGYARLAMMFTNSLSNIYGITMYDLTQAIRNGEVPRAFTTAIGLTLAAMYITALTSGGPDEPDDPEEWAKWTASAFTEQTINSIPLIGKEALALWDYRRGYFKNDSAFIAPFAKLAAGTRVLWDDKNDNDERAIWNLIEGGSLLAPFPSTALHRLYNVGKELGEGEIGAALKRVVGINKEEKKIKKAVSY